MVLSHGGTSSSRNPLGRRMFRIATIGRNTLIVRPSPLKRSSRVLMIVHDERATIVPILCRDHGRRRLGVTFPQAEIRLL
jgi:hypothetical protein